jgi:hypothetical protein
MGLVESKLIPQNQKSIIIHEKQTLPSFSMDIAKFQDGSSGFIITSVDLAKNSTVRTISINFAYSPADNSITFVGHDETIISFVKDRLSGKIVCSISSITKETIVRFCVTTYEPIDDVVIDKIGELYSMKSQIPL